MIDWDAVSRAIRFPEQALWEAEQRRAIAAQKAALAADAPTEAAAATSVPAEGGNGEHGASTATRTPMPLKRSVPPLAPAERNNDPVGELSAALDAAASDAQRTALLAAAPKQTRERFNAFLTYRKLIRDSNVDVYAAFTGQLDAAADDAARLALIAQAQRDPQRGAAFLSEWTWRRSATAEDWRRRYLVMACGSASADLT